MFSFLSSVAKRPLTSMQPPPAQPFPQFYVCDVAVGARCVARFAGGAVGRHPGFRVD
jgi:hypothetical protein